MNDNTPELLALARDAFDCFESGEGADGRTFFRTGEGSPGWVRDLVYSAHGGDFLPDDYRYQWTMEACETIADASPEDELDDLAHEFANDVTPYTSERLAWVGSNLRRVGYVDDAVEEFGVPDDGGLDAMLGTGMYAERYEVFYLVAQFLAARLGTVAS
jgi:hypothetical protein